jgi:N-acetylglucosamine malate deacetylase 2
MTITTATPLPRTDPASVGESLPRAVAVLAVTARPRQETVDLGGLLYAFGRVGADLSLLCLTRGEAGQNSGNARLEAIRPWETQLAASILGIGAVAVANYRDGELPDYSTAELAERITRAIGQRSADMLLVVAPEAGDRADAAVARAAQAAAAAAGVPVVASTRPGVRGAWTVDLGADTETVRAIQKSAAAAHGSQSEALPALVRRLDLLGSGETLRWLLFPQRIPAQHEDQVLITASAPGPARSLSWRAGSESDRVRQDRGRRPGWAPTPTATR